MSIENNIKKEVADLRRLAENELTIYRKLDELIELLSKSDIDSETAKTYQKRLDKALNKQIQKKTVTNISAPKEPVDADVDDLDIFLTSDYFESKLSDEKTVEKSGLSQYALFAICGITLTIGFLMFMMPNLSIFDMLNSVGDGISLLNILALLITVTGVCFLIMAIYRKPNRPKYKHN